MFPGDVAVTYDDDDDDDDEASKTGYEWI